MARCYTICRVIGTGGDDDPQRAECSDLPTANVKARIKVNPQTGLKVFNFAFCRAGIAPTLLPIMQLTNSLVFPDYPLDAAMSGMAADVRLAFRQSVQAYDLDGLGTHITLNDGDSEPWRDVIIRIARVWDAGFNSLEQFEVAEPLGDQ